jgi:iron complex outermembrane recepter protein
MAQNRRLTGPGRPISLRDRARRLACGLLLACGAATSLAGARQQEDFSEMDFPDLAQIKVTSVTRRTEALFHSPAAVTVVRGEEIRRMGATTIPEALRLVPGVQVARIDSQNWAITARGLNRQNANKLLVLIDGRTVYSPLFDGVLWDQQHVMMEDIDRIEVIRGPGGTQWGANAVNGVVNIVTRAATQTEGTLLVAGGGLEERLFGAARYGAKYSEGDAGLRFYLTAFVRDGTEQSDGSDFGDDWTMGQAGFRYDWDRSTKESITFQGDVYKTSEEQLPTIFSATPPFAEVRRETLHAEGNNLLARWTRRMPKGSELQVQMYFDRAERVLEDQFGRLAVNTADLDVVQRLNPSGRVTWTLGLGHRQVWDNLDDRFTVSWTELRRVTRRESGFAQAEIALVPDKVMLTAGTKLEWNEYTDFEYQPTLRLGWAPGESQFVWGAVSRAVRTPSRSEVSVRSLVVPNLSPVATQARGTGGLDAEEEISWEAGYRFQKESRYMIDTALFMTRYDHLISPLELPPEPAGPLPFPNFPFTFDNSLHGDARGLEVGARWLPAPRWRLDAAYTLLYVDIESERGPTGPLFSKQALEQDEGTTPRTAWSVRSSLDLPRRWQVDGGVRYVGRLDTPQVDSYLAGDVRVGWSAGELFEISLTARDVGPRHAEFGPPRSGDLTRPEVQPRYFLTTRWRF